MKKIQAVKVHTLTMNHPVYYLEVYRHVGGVALVARVDVVVEAGVGGAAVVVALVQHHVVHVARAAGREDGPVANHLKHGNL